MTPKKKFIDVFIQAFVQASIPKSLKCRHNIFGNPYNKLTKAEKQKVHRLQAWGSARWGTEKICELLYQESQEFMKRH